MSAASREAPQTDAPPPEVSPGGSHRFLRLFTETTAMIFVVLLVLIVIFSALRPEAFATLGTARNIAIAASSLLVLAVGMTFVIITAGIDLSVGSVLVFASVVAVKAMEQVGGGAGWGSVAAGVAAGLVAGTAWGLINGFLVAKAKIPSLIVTLGTLGAALGSAQLITGGVDLRGVPRELVSTIGLGAVLGIPWLVVIALVVTVIGAVTLRLTRFGRYTLAIGSNPEAARRVGINVDRHLIKIYAVAGLLSGLAGVMSLARFTTTTIAGHTTDNLQAIAGVVIGGTSLFGGIGTILGTVVGILIPVILQFGFVILRVDPFWQTVAVGVVLIAAVYVDQLKRAARERL